MLVYILYYHHVNGHVYPSPTGISPVLQPPLYVFKQSLAIHTSMILGAATPALSPVISFKSPAKQLNGSVVVCSASKHASNKALTGVVFQPFEEVKKELMLVPAVPHLSLARHKYCNDSEAVINDQIKSVLSFSSLLILSSSFCPSLMHIGTDLGRGTNTCPSKKMLLFHHYNCSKDIKLPHKNYIE